MRRTICSVLIAVVLFNTATPVYAQWTVVDPTILVQIDEPVSPGSVEWTRFFGQCRACGASC